MLKMNITNSITISYSNNIWFWPIQKQTQTNPNLPAIRVAGRLAGKPNLHLTDNLGASFANIGPRQRSK